MMVDEEALKLSRARRMTPALDQFGANGISCVWLVSNWEKEKPTAIGMSYLIVRAYLSFLLGFSLGHGRRERSASHCTKRYIKTDNSI
jgi:hypothetical protein